jgi:hypothetical protein
LFAAVQGSDSAPLSSVNWGRGRSFNVCVTAFPCNRRIAVCSGLRLLQN